MAREGKDLSIVTYAATVWKALEAAEQLEREDKLSVEVLDLRSLLPMDDDAIVATVKKTNRVLIVHEDTVTGGVAGEITARINELAFEWLDAPVRRVLRSGGSPGVTWAGSSNSAQPARRAAGLYCHWAAVSWRTAAATRRSSSASAKWAPRVQQPSSGRSA